MYKLHSSTCKEIGEALIINSILEENESHAEMNLHHSHE